MLAVDLSFLGETWKSPELASMLEVLSGEGERPIGVETWQLLEIARCATERAQAAQVRVEAVGMRSQLVALLAAALHPALFSEVDIRHALRSLDAVLKKPVEYEAAPELFCLDLLRETDLDRLAALSQLVRVVSEATQ